MSFSLLHTSYVIASVKTLRVFPQKAKERRPKVESLPYRLLHYTSESSKMILRYTEANLQAHVQNISRPLIANLQQIKQFVICVA